MRRDEQTPLEVQMSFLFLALLGLANLFQFLGSLAILLYLIRVIAQAKFRLRKPCVPHLLEIVTKNKLGG